MARISVRFPVILILAFTFLIHSYPWTKLLTKNVEEVQKITVVNLRNDNSTSKITQVENRELINTIYRSINTTKTRTETKPDASEEQSSDPFFTITINYLDGTKDSIYSTEGSRFIYRRLSGNGWVGGKNNFLIEVVNRLTI